MTTSPAERDPQALTDAERAGLCPQHAGHPEEHDPVRDLGCNWSDTVIDGVLTTLSARPSATTDTAAQALRALRTIESCLSSIGYDDNWAGTVRNALRNVDDLRAALDPGTRTAHHDTGRHEPGA